MLYDAASITLWNKVRVIGLCPADVSECVGKLPRDSCKEKEVPEENEVILLRSRASLIETTTLCRQKVTKLDPQPRQLYSEILFLDTTRGAFSLLTDP